MIELNMLFFVSMIVFAVATIFVGFNMQDNSRWLKQNNTLGGKKAFVIFQRAYLNSYWILLLCSAMCFLGFIIT